MIPCFDPATCPVAELTQHIRETHHAYLREELPAMWDLLREGASAARGPGAGLRPLARAFGQLRSSLENHLRKEEQVLFPFVEQLERTLGAGEPPPVHAFGSLALPIEILEAEHALGDRLLERMRPMWQQWADDDDSPRWQRELRVRFGRFEADMQRHVHLEDAILFPRTIQLEGRPWPLPAASL